MGVRRLTGYSGVGASHIQQPDEDMVNDGWVDDEDESDNEQVPLHDFLFTSPLPSQIGLLAKKKPLFLPSSIGYQKCHELGLQHLTKKELSLREGQANDALHGIRMAIGEKSFRF